MPASPVSDDAAYVVWLQVVGGAIGLLLNIFVLRSVIKGFFGDATTIFSNAIDKTLHIGAEGFTKVMEKAVDRTEQLHDHEHRLDAVETRIEDMAEATREHLTRIEKRTDDIYHMLAQKQIQERP